MLLVALIGFCAIARRLSTGILTAPVLFGGLGVLFAVQGWLPEVLSETALHIFAESALVVLLFLDAAKINLKSLVRPQLWPFRMLLIGLPLSILFGIAAGMLLLPSWPFAAIALIAAIMAPTDAALGLPVVSYSKLPTRVRNALIIESGLNDGLALPAVLVFAAIAGTTHMADADWMSVAALQIIVGPLAGLAVGCLGGWLMRWAQDAGWTESVYEGIATLALAALAYFVAIEFGGNGFLAAFCGGLGFGGIMRGRCSFVYDFTESEGQVLSWVAFLLIGALLVPEAIVTLSLAQVALILASLLIVRPLAILISLIGTDAPYAARLFFGWFGPRGLATALFALLVLDRLDHALSEQVLHLAVNTVWISAVLHGVTAAPLARLFANRADFRALNTPTPQQEKS